MISFTYIIYIFLPQPIAKTGSLLSKNVIFPQATYGKAPGLIKPFLTGFLGKSNFNKLLKRGSITMTKTRLVEAVAIKTKLERFS